MALFAVLGYAYIVFILAGVFALLGLIVATIVFSHRVNTGMIKMTILLLILAGVILQSLWVTFPRPQGVRLSRQQAPKLFALVDELTTQLQAPCFHNILLNQDFNAAVVQVPRLGIFGWQENYLLLGLPLMQALSLAQLKAVLAHELGHLSGNHSRFAGWIYRIRKTWMQLYEQLHQTQQQGASFLFNAFINWYWPSFDAYSFVLARMNEYEADRCAAQLAGARNAAEALINVEVKARFLEDSFWAEIGNQMEHQAEPPDNVYSSMLTVLHQPIAEEKRQVWLEQAFAQTTNNADTHPCLSDRLNSLGFSIAQAQQLQPKVGQTSAAEQLLGKTLQQFIAQFNQTWKETAETPWRQRYAHLQEIKGKLQALEEKTQTQALTEKELWERAYYTLELRGNEAAIPFLQDVLNQQPDHATANYMLGQILLKNKADATGIAYVEKAIEHRIDWVIDGCGLIYNFLSQKGESEAAKQYRERAEQHYQILQKAQHERSIVTDQDTLKPHSLNASEVEQLKQQLINYPLVKEAYLAEKVVNYYPENRFFVLGVIRKQDFIDTGEKTQQLLDQLVNNIQLPSQSYVIVLNHSNFTKLKKKMQKIDRALVFRR